MKETIFEYLKITTGTAGIGKPECIPVIVGRLIATFLFLLIASFFGCKYFLEENKPVNLSAQVNDILVEEQGECIPVWGMALANYFTNEQIKEINKIRPYIIGLGTAFEFMDWIEKVDYSNIFNYNARKFYGCRSYEFLMSSPVSSIDVIGYCPFKDDFAKNKDISIEDRVRNIGNKHINSEIFIGPPIGLYTKELIDEINKGGADYLLFEVFPFNYQQYLNGEFDALIEYAFSTRDTVGFGFDMISDQNIDLMADVFEKAKKQGFYFAYGAPGGLDQRKIEFIKDRHCSY